MAKKNSQKNDKIESTKIDNFRQLYTKNRLLFCYPLTKNGKIWKYIDIKMVHHTGVEPVSVASEATTLSAELMVHVKSK